MAGDVVASSVAEPITSFLWILRFVFILGNNFVRFSNSY